MRCLACGTENEPQNRFCERCGRSLVGTCPTCGNEVSPAARFCGKCGTSLTTDAGEPLPPGADVRAGQPSVAERRLVSILFADLGGFTTGQEVGARDLLERAQATFERLRATPWLERADRVRLAEAAAGV